MNTTTRPSAKDVYAIITERITAALERGTAPWHRTWSAGLAPQSLVTRHPYRGVNVFVLSMTARAAGYGSPYWLTYNQARSMGGNVKRGEHGTPVVFWKFFEAPAVDDADGRELEATETTRSRRRPPLLRYYTVFNAEQTEGIAVPSPIDAAPAAPIDAAEQIVAGMPRAPRIVESLDGDGAYYAPRLDTVHMPARSRFRRSKDFYGVLFHELTHSTGHVSRLNRATLNEAGRFGDANYSREELVAEMGAAFLCGVAGIENSTIEQSAAYLKGWLRALSSEPRMLVIAAAQAQKAADYILGRAQADTTITEPAEMPAAA
jgi:antirestriction protein ArdC